jgi:hypothetical protein
MFSMYVIVVVLGATAAVLLIVLCCCRLKVLMCVYGQKNSNPYDLWMLAELEAALPPEKRKTGIDIAVQLSIRDGNVTTTTTTPTVAQLFSSFLPPV